MTTTTNARCQATKKDGSACTAYALNDSAYCWAHDPGQGRARAEARRAGGKARHGRKLTGGDDGPILIGSLEEITASLERVLNETWRLENSNARNRTMISGLSVAADLYQVGELEARLEALEEALRGRGYAKIA